MKQQYIYLCAKEYIDGAIWAITTFRKQLVRINVKTGEVNIELELMEEGKQQNYAEIVGLGEDRFLLIPRNNKQLLYVDVRKNEQFFVDVECEEETDELCVQWIGKWQNDNFAYLFPGNSNYILKIDKKNIVCSCCKELIDEIKETTGIPAVNIGDAICEYRGSIYLALINENLVIKVDEKITGYEVFSVNNDASIKGFRSIEIIEGKMYLLDKESHLIVYEMDSKKYLKKIKLQENYGGIRKHAMGLLLVPMHRDKFAFFDIDKEILEKIEYSRGVLEGKFPVERRAKYYVNNMQDKEHYFFLLPYGNSIIIINKNNILVEWVNVRLGNSVFELLEADKSILLVEDMVQMDMITIGLEDYINYIKTSHKSDRELECKETIGKRIHLITIGKRECEGKRC